MQLNFLTSVRPPLIRRESLTDLQIRDSRSESMTLGNYYDFYNRYNVKHLLLILL